MKIKPINFDGLLLFIGAALLPLYPFGSGGVQPTHAVLAAFAGATLIKRGVPSASWSIMLLKSDLARRFAKRVKTAINKRAVRSIDPRMAWCKAAQPVANELAQKADVVVSTFGPSAAHLIAHDMKQSKLFEYMASGRPILGIGSLPEYEIGRVLETSGTGKTFGADSYSDLLDVIYKGMNGGGLLQSFDPNIVKILVFSRKNIALKLLGHIKAYVNA